jgi:hypothetical protein
MDLEKLAHKARRVWQDLAAAPIAARPKLYWGWCRKVIMAQQEELPINEAANLLIWPDALDNKLGFGSNAEIQIILDCADSLASGADYFDAPQREQRAWARLAERVNRHSDDA